MPLVLFGILLLLEPVDLLDSLPDAGGPGDVGWALLAFVAPIAFIGHAVLGYRYRRRARRGGSQQEI